MQESTPPESWHFGPYPPGLWRPKHRTPDALAKAHAHRSSSVNFGLQTFDLMANNSSRRQDKWHLPGLPFMLECMDKERGYLLPPVPFLHW